MSPTIAAVIGLISLFVMIAVRMPVSFAMILAGLFGNAYVISTDAALYMLATNVWGQLSSYGLSVIPLFVFMGQLTFHSGITERLYDLNNSQLTIINWLFIYRGRLASNTGS